MDLVPFASAVSPQPLLSPAVRFNPWPHSSTMTGAERRITGSGEASWTLSRTVGPVRDSVTVKCVLA